MSNVNLPKGWRRLTFGEVTQSITERMMPTPQESRHYIGLEHMQSGSLVLTGLGSKVDLVGAKFRMRKGDVLFARRNPHLRRVAVAPHDGPFSAHGLILRTRDSLVLLQEFLPFFLQSEEFMSRANQIAVGSLSRTINWKDLAVQEFSFPPVEEQQRIVQLLSLIDKTLILKSSVDSDQLLNALYSQSGKSLIKETKLGEVCSFRTASVKELDLQSSFNYIDLSCVSRDRGIEHSLVEKHAVATAPSRAQRIVETGDVLVATVRPNLRAVARVSSEESGWVASTGFTVLRPQNETDSLFLFGLTLTEKFTNHLVQRAIGSNYPAVRNSDIESFPIPLEIWEKRQEISRVVRQILDMQNLIKTEIKNLQQLRKTALERYLLGEVNV